MNVSQKKKRPPRRVTSQQSRKLTKKQRQQLKQREERQQGQLTEKRATTKRRMLKRVMGWSGVLLGLILSVLGLIYLTDNSEREGATHLTDSTPDSGWVLGNPAAPISLVEYSDYQCYSCARYHYMNKQLAAELGDDFQLVHRHYPLPEHANAELAARSAEAAGRQGKFWEMHHLLFARQKEWAKKAKAEAERIFVQYAASLNLDTEQFQGDLRSQEIIDKITNDYQEGRRYGVKVTPTFFLNGEKIIGKPRTYEEFKALIIQSKANRY